MGRKSQTKSRKQSQRQSRGVRQDFTFPEVTLELPTPEGSSVDVIAPLATRQKNSDMSMISRDSNRSTPQRISLASRESARDSYHSQYSDIIEKKRKKRGSQSQAEKPRITLGFENELTLDDLCTNPSRNSRNGRSSQGKATPRTSRDDRTEAAQERLSLLRQEASNASRRSSKSRKRISDFGL